MATATLQPLVSSRVSESVSEQFFSGKRSVELPSLVDAEKFLDTLEGEGASDLEAELLTNGKVRVTWR